MGHNYIMHDNGAAAASATKVAKATKAANAYLHALFQTPSPPFFRQGLFRSPRSFTVINVKEGKIQMYGSMGKVGHKEANEKIKK